jgi:hypothetical protein
MFDDLPQSILHQRRTAASLGLSGVTPATHYTRREKLLSGELVGSEVGEKLDSMERLLF